MILAGCQGIPKSLADDVLNVRVHADMRARSGANEKPRRYLVAGDRGCKGVVCGPAHTQSIAVHRAFASPVNPAQGSLSCAQAVPAISKVNAMTAVAAEISRVVILSSLTPEKFTSKGIAILYANWGIQTQGPVLDLKRTVPIRLTHTPTTCSVSCRTAGKGSRCRNGYSIWQNSDCAEVRTWV